MHRPTLRRPTLRRPTLRRPTLRRPTLRRPRYADVAATLALIVALGGTAAAAAGALPRKSVGKGQLKVGAVINPKIGDHAISVRNMKTKSVQLKNLIGEHSKTTLSASLVAGTCTRFVITTPGTGGATGQPAFLAFTGGTSTPMPAGLTVSPLQLLDGSAADVSFCNNNSTGTITLNDQPIEIMSFGAPQK